MASVLAIVGKKVFDKECKKPVGGLYETRSASPCDVQSDDVGSTQSPTAGLVPSSGAALR